MKLSNELTKQVHAHLDKVRRHLTELPADERQEILQSIESHIYDALESRSDGDPGLELLDAVIAEMDPPDSYGERPPTKQLGSVMKPFVSAAVVLTAILLIWVAFGINKGSTPAHTTTTVESEQPPVVVSTFPLKGKTAVDPNITELRVTFNKDMLTDRMWSWCIESPDTAPKFVSDGTTFIDKRTCVTSVELEPNKTYVVWINTQKNNAFRDIDHNPAAPYRLEFKTGNVQSPDPIGHWQSVDFVESIEQFDPNTKKWRGDLYLKELTFLPDGKTDRPFWTWKDGFLHHAGDNTDEKFLIKKISGTEYLFLEWMSDDVTLRGQPPKYYVLKKSNPAVPQAAFDLQQAIDTASTGATITIPEGTYTRAIVIHNEITLDGNGAVLKVQSNQPAIQIDTPQLVVLKNLEIQYQTKTKPQKGEFPYAVYTSGGNLLIENCTFKETGRSGAVPCAVSATDGSALHIKNSRFDGFNYTIQFWNESEGSVDDCLIMNSGHCGITIGGGSSADLSRNIVTGSRYHGIRCTGGEIVADSNLVIANKNRGFYIGNKSAAGTLSNNLIVDNATGINVFANSKLDINNNLILRSSYSGLSLADTADVDVENNIIVENERGVVGFSADKGKTPSVNLRGGNIVYGNTTQSEGIKLPSEMIGIDPQFEDPDAGLFTTGTRDAQGMGLTNPTDVQVLWNKWKEATSR